MGWRSASIMACNRRRRCLLLPLVILVWGTWQLHQMERVPRLPSAWHGLLNSQRPPMILSRFKPSQSSWGTGWERTWHQQCVGLRLAIEHHALVVQGHPERQPLVYRPTHHGLGDRLKGTRSLFLLAVATGRPMRIVADSHFSHDYVVPSFYNWSLTAGPLRSSADSTRSLFDGPWSEAQALRLLDDRRSVLWDYSQPLFTSTNLILGDLFAARMCLHPVGQRPLTCPAELSDGRARHVQEKLDNYCIFRALFQPSFYLKERLEQRMQLLPLLRQAETPQLRLVVGIHVRFGGGRDESRANDGDAVELVQCAFNVSAMWMQAAAAQGVEEALWVRMVLASDQPTRLRAVIDHFHSSLSLRLGNSLVDYVTALPEDGRVLHNNDPESDAAALFRAWLDYLLLGECHLGVYFRSGFSRVAFKTSQNRALVNGRLYEKQRNNVLLCDTFDY